MNDNIKSNVASEIPVTQNHPEGISEVHQPDLCIRDVMNTPVLTVTSEETIMAGAKIMSENHISCLPVVDKDVFRGLITQRIILTLIARQSRDIDSIRVQEHMLRAVSTISSDISVQEAARIASSNKIKWLPVLTEQTIVGIITQTDLVQALVCFDCFPDVASIMSRDAITIDPATSVVEAANVMAKHNISCIVAQRKERVIGILTEKDLLKTAIEHGKSLSDTLVVDIMSYPVIAANPSDSMISASRLMGRMRIHHMAVMEGEQLCGVLTHTDVLKAFRESFVQYAGLYDLLK